MKDLYDRMTTHRQEPPPSIPSREDEVEALMEALIECGDIEGSVTE